MALGAPTPAVCRIVTLAGSQSKDFDGILYEAIQVDGCAPKYFFAKFEGDGLLPLSGVAAELAEHAACGGERVRYIGRTLHSYGGAGLMIRLAHAVIQDDEVRQTVLKQWGL